MSNTYRHGGYTVSEGEWTPWYTFAGMLEKVKHEGGWEHILRSNLDEPDPDANHIHTKQKPNGSGGYTVVLCRVKIDDMGSINRRKLIEAVNFCTGLDLDYR